MRFFLHVVEYMTFSFKNTYNAKTNLVYIDLTSETSMGIKGIRKCTSGLEGVVMVIYQLKQGI